MGILNDGRDLDSLNLTDIVLIPKLPNPTSLVNFRPISLSTVLYKIVAKTIPNRLQEVIGKRIDKAQSAFIPRRLITDNVLVAYELLHTLRQKQTGKNGLVVVKLDMSKAYDRVEWAFLKEVVIQIGFVAEWVTLIMKCMSTVSYIVNINGRKGDDFKPTRGLCQGNPLSPFLFLIYSEGFSSLIRMSTVDGSMEGGRASRRGPEILHLLFTDDIVW